MSWSKVYPFSATANNEVNSGVLAQQVEDSAIDTGVNPLLQVADSTGTQAILIEFTDPLSGGDEAVLDGVVGAHVGEPYAPNVMRATAIPIVPNATTTPVDVIDETIPLPLAAGDYEVAWACEIRLQSATPGAGVHAELSLNGAAVYEDNWDLDQWHTFAGAGSTKFKAGDKPTLALSFRRIGAAATVEMRRARISLISEHLSG